MYKRLIRLSNLDQVHEFVKLADAFDFDVNIGYDRIVIDAKSIMGVMGLDLGRKLTVSFDGDAPELESFCENHTA